VTVFTPTILLCAGGTGGHLFPAESLAHALRARGIRAVNLNSTVTPASLVAIADLAATGRLRVSIDAEVRLEEVPAAIAAARAGHARGKTVIVP
jgi:NADPH:quinone reductase-like Zn-dependent oxidoreductase